MLVTHMPPGPVMNSIGNALLIKVRILCIEGHPQSPQVKVGTGSLRCATLSPPLASRLLTCYPERPRQGSQVSISQS